MIIYSMINYDYSSTALLFSSAKVIESQCINCCYYSKARGVFIQVSHDLAQYPSIHVTSFVHAERLSFCIYAQP